ncbi:RNA methyltransferase [bacterium]|nr:MAG: RNA methyltransferase [bacterium]
MLALALPKAKAKLLRKLEQRKYRQELKLYVAEGYRSIGQHIVSNPESIQFIVQPENSDILFPEKETFWVSKSEFDTYSQTRQSQGVIAVVSMPDEMNLNEILNNAELILALDAIQDPGNLGTIVRNALWFGVDALVLGTGTVDLFNPKTVRSTMSTLAALPFCSASLDDSLTLAEQFGFKVYLMRLDDSATPLHEINFAKKSLIVIGNEGNGIQESLIQDQRETVFIPAYSNGETESLNAGVAAAIALYACKSQPKSS